MKFGILEVLSWVLAILTFVLVIWRIVGNSPSELAVFGGVASFLFLQVFNLEKKVIRLEMGTRNSFVNMKRDVNLIKERLGIR